MQLYQMKIVPNQLCIFLPPQPGHFQQSDFICASFTNGFFRIIDVSIKLIILIKNNIASFKIKRKVLMVMINACPIVVNYFVTGFECIFAQSVSSGKH